MTAFYWVSGFILALLVAVLLAGRAGLFSGSPPGDLGVRGGRLKPPSSTENSVSSQASLYPDHPQRDYAEIAPIALHGDGPTTIATIARVIATMRGTRIVVRDPDYLYAQFTTRTMRFVDDAEFWFDPTAQVVQVRSASRVGRKDFGANRQRVEAIRSALNSS